MIYSISYNVYGKLQVPNFGFETVLLRPSIQNTAFSHEAFDFRLFLDLNGTKGKSPVASPQKIRSSRPSLKGKSDSQPKNQPAPKKDQTKNRGNDSKNPVSLADSGFVSSHPSKNGIDQ